VVPGQQGQCSLRLHPKSEADAEMPSANASWQQVTPGWRDLRATPRSPQATISSHRAPGRSPPHPLPVPSMAAASIPSSSSYHLGSTCLTPNRPSAGSSGCPRTPNFDHVLSVSPRAPPPHTAKLRDKNQLPVKSLLLPGAKEPV
jgi:hypothetical protein